MTVVAPPAVGARDHALDVVRGFALLGILVMNIRAFAMPAATYFNATVWGNLDGANWWVWFLGDLLFDQKFMTLFSVLFGAGLLLFADRAAAKGQSAAWLHYRRMGWLLLFGLAHAYLLWWGDILVTYALCGLLVFLLRKASPRKLAVMGGLALVVPVAVFVTMGLTIESWPQDMYDDALKDWAPGEGVVSDEVAAYRGSWLDQMAHRVPQVLLIHSFYFPLWLFWRAGGLMLLGMAAYKWGILSGARSPRFYARLAVVGLAVGLPIVLAGIAWKLRTDFAFQSSFVYDVTNYIGSLFVTAGYLGVVLLVIKAGWWRGLMARLGAVGRTAFSNYLLQTIIATTIFYGHGFGLFGHVDRVGQTLVVVGIVGAQLVLAPWWLRHFAYGPFEWVWRTLTYGRFAAFRVGRPARV